MDESPIDPFENSILLSILGECALALENEKNAREKQEAAVLKHNKEGNWITLIICLQGKFRLCKQEIKH